MAQGTWREDSEENRKLQEKYKTENHTDLGHFEHLTHEQALALQDAQPENPETKRMSGLTPTKEDMQWYRARQEDRQEKSEQEQWQQWNESHTTPAAEWVMDKAMGLAGYAFDLAEAGSDSVAGQFLGQMLQGLSDADHLVKEGYKLTPGGGGEHVKTATEITEAVVSLGGSSLLRNAPKLARKFAQGGADDLARANQLLQKSGVGQATLATLQEGIDRIPPMGPQLQVSLAGVGNLDSYVKPRMQQLQPPTVMKAVTITDPEILRGVRGGIETGADLSSPAQSKQLITRSTKIEQKELRVSELNEQLTALKELENDPKNLQIYLNNNPEIKDIYNRKKGNMTKVYKSLNERKTDAQEALSQAQSNVLPFDKEGPGQNFFRTKPGLDAKRAEESARALREWLEQHHLFPKGVSAAYFSKMDDLIAKGKATKDDLIAMAEFAANQGRRTGDVRANLLNMLKDPHNELHTILRDQGAEIPKSAIQNSLKDVKNVDELMARWKEILAGDVAYNMDTAKIWEPLDNLLKEIQSK